MKDEDAKLDRLLGEWQPSARRNPDFGAAVWRKISEREETRWETVGDDRKVVSFQERWTGLAMAACLGMGAILAGIGLAEVRLQGEREIASVQSPQQAYFESINPVALARHEHVHQ